MADLIETVTLDLLRDMFQACGFRAAAATDADGQAFLRSATGGLAFDVRLGNADPADATAALDVRLVAAIEIKGELPLDLVNSWNNARRFCRLHVDGRSLLLDMDVSVAGGVAPAWLERQIELWDRLVQILIEHLKDELARTSRPALAAAS